MLFDDVIVNSKFKFIVTSLHLSELLQPKDRACPAMINCSKFHQVPIKIKKGMERGGGAN